MATTAPPGPASSRARSTARARVGLDLAPRGAAELARTATRASPAAARAGCASAVNTAPAHERQQRAQHPGGVLVVEHREHRDQRPLADRVAAARRRARPRRWGCARRRGSSAGRSADDLQAPGDVERGDAARAPRASSSAPISAAGGGAARRRSSRAGSRAAATPVAGSGAHDRAGGRPWPALGLGLGSSSPSTSVAAGRTTASFSRAMSAIVGPSQRVCSRPTLVSTDDGRVEHVGGVVAPAEAGLDDRDLDPARGELGERRGGQQLELGDAVAARERAVDLARRRAAARSTAAPKALGVEVGVADADALGEARRGAARGRRRCARRGPRGSPRSCARSSSCRSCRRRGSARKARCGLPSAVSSRRMRSSPKRMPNSSSESRWASARSRRPAALIRAPSELRPAARASLSRSAWTTASAAPWPRSPRWRACPRRARSRPRSRVARAPPRGAPRPRGRRRRRRAARRCRPGPGRWPPARVPSGGPVDARQPRDVRRRCARSPRPPAAPAARGPGAAPTRSRHARSSCTAAIARAELGLGGRVASASSPARPPARPSAGPRCRARSDQISSVTNGITGWASASVSRSTCSATSPTRRCRRRTGAA